jgi:hypothetical protein
MLEQNLILNILTFNHPVEQKNFAFYTEKKNGCYPINHYEFPLNIAEIIPDAKSKKFEQLYTDFENTLDKEAVIPVDLIKCTRFAKHYYSWVIYNHFKTVVDIVNSNFVNDLEVWFHDKNESTSEYKAYKVFTIRVQIARNAATPEMIISYDSISLVHEKSILDLDIETTMFKRVVYEKQIYKYDKLPDEAKYHWEKVFPILNNTLKYALNIPVQPNRKGTNRYKVYKSNLDYFINAYIKSKQFSSIIPLNDENYLKVETIRVKNTTPGSNLLQFGQNKMGAVPYNGLIDNGPYSHCPFPHVNMFFICHESDKEKANLLYTYFKSGYKNFPKLDHLLKVPLNIIKNDQITFSNIENPLPEIKQSLFSKSFDNKIRYIAIYLSPFSKNDPELAKRQYYFQVKEELLKYGITSQVIETKKISDPNFNYNLINIAVAILAKLNGVPWRLHRALHNELIVGVGAFKSVNLSACYIGSAFCFSNDGHFKGFECNSQNDIYKLAVSISKAIKNYRKQNSEIKRLIIHFYKTMSHDELEPIKKELQNMGLDIPVIIITINKTESKDLVLFDLNCPELIPVSGTFISIGRNQFLLCNNTRYENSLPKSTEGYPFPIKLSMFASDPKLLADGKLIKDLIDQVYQFSRMYWKSVRQQNLPVTIKYPEMVAEIFPHFESNILPEFGKNNLWFL